MIIRFLAAHVLRGLTPLIVNGLYGDFWIFRERKHKKITAGGIWGRLYCYYQERYGCYIGEHAEFAEKPVFPHGMYGVFISTMAKVGKGAVVFQQVTIGSNTLKGHPRCGSPTIGNNVYIGAGAKIIGKVTIGDNCRIGANCVVVKDMAPNTTAVAASTRFLTSDQEPDNTFVSAKEYLEE